MHFPVTWVAFMAAVLPPAIAFPATSKMAPLKDAVNAVPGESPLFNTYLGKKTPLASNYTKVFPKTGSGSAGADDLLFQNLLAAEWIIYSFYQQAVEAFNTSSFTDLGYPNTTYQRIVEMRDNEAGHVRIFQDQISDNSVTPGPCKYGFSTTQLEPLVWLSLQTYLETASMAYLTGLVLDASLSVSKSALLAIGTVESRHNTWSLIDVWNTGPFSGPSDTTYPYANQILDATNAFIIPDSCPSENPVYPSPRQNLPQMGFVNKTGTTGHPGSKISFRYTDKNNQPHWNASENYYAVFFHGLNNISVPYDPKINSVAIPRAFDSDAGLIIVSIANTPHAPTEDSVVAGPLILLEQPALLTMDSPTFAA
jgi:hypothetical protein